MLNKIYNIQTSSKNSLHKDYVLSFIARLITECEIWKCALYLSPSTEVSLPLKSSVTGYWISMAEVASSPLMYLGNIIISDINKHSKCGWLTSWASLLGWNGGRNSWQRWHPRPCSGAGCLISRGRRQEDLKQDGVITVSSWHRRVSLHYQQLWGSSDSWQFGRAGPPQTPHTGSYPHCWVWHSSGRFWSPRTGAPENGR